MPKQSKTKAQSKAKSQTKTKQKPQPETPGLTTNKWYWIMLTIVMVAVFSVASYLVDFRLEQIVVLMFAIALLIGLIGYVRITPSNLPMSKRATFLFIGASVIGFGSWAIIIFVALTTGLIENLNVTSFYVLPSFIISMIIGAFIGEMLGKNSRIQLLFFKTADTT
jgi:hypothetical protein